ncbi:MAG: uL22 family ribosomal protein, partial [Patescibacteria group bacterium]
AKNLKCHTTTILMIQSIFVTDGTPLHRFRPVSRGRAHPFKKHASHITVELALNTTSDSETHSDKKKTSKK